MKRKILSAFLFLAVLMNIQWSSTQNNIDRTAFYAAMQKEDVKLVDDQLAVVKKSKMKEKIGFEGALLMKKAGLVKRPKQKLDKFKEGHKKLEEEIKQYPENAELRFLRLMIQENAPGILNYKSEIEEDVQFIQKSFNKLPKPTQEAVRNYSKTSKVLDSSAF